jgi:iron complex outermembrane receptor protein
MRNWRFFVSHRSAQRQSLRAVAICLFAFISFEIAPKINAQEAIAPAISPEPPAEPPSNTPSPTELKKLSLEELVDLEVTSASRRPEKLSQTASAVDVITAEDIERAGVTNIPDALRLGTEMDVAQVDGHSWAISARGFANMASNKLQVLMDGRSLYTPLFSGVFWDVQQTFLPDIEQIEIIRGPGATLWGANAVNGVINIRTKSADETQGFMLYGGGGFEQDDFEGMRYGGKLGTNTYYRVYVMHQDNDGLPLQVGSAEDDMHITQGGFRIDSKYHPDDTFTFQGDFYAGTFEQLNTDDVDVNGQDVIARWTHQFDKDSSLMLQAYYDRTYRLIPTTFEEERNTFDLELQHEVRFDEHYIVYGAEYRLSHDDIANIGPGLAFIPATDTEHLLSGYLQDEWHIVPDTFYLTGGSKFEYNSFSGFEVQPTGRFTWLPTTNQTIWGAISRAVRTPTRLDQDLVAPNPAFATPFLLANPDFESETLVAYELGYRIKPNNDLSFDLTGFYNDYDDLRSVEPLRHGRLTIENKLEGQTAGGSLATRWHIFDWWHLDGSIWGISEDIHKKAGGHDISHARAETNDPDVAFMAHSGMDLPWNLMLDAYLRYVDDLPHPRTNSYLTGDVRLAWSPRKNCVFAIVGRNLFDNAHPEFAATPTREVERSVYATFKWNF